MRLLIVYVTFLLSSGLFAKAPDFSLRDLDGNLIKLENLLGNGPVVLDFWATWCKPCIKILPKMQDLYKEFQDDGLVVLGINQDGPRSSSKVGPFVHSLGLTFPVLLDTEQEVVRKFQVSGFPTTILLDAKGNVIETLRGYRPGDEAKLKIKIMEQLGEQKE